MQMNGIGRIVWTSMAPSSGFITQHDSTSVSLPPPSLTPDVIDIIAFITRRGDTSPQPARLAQCFFRDG